MAKLTGCGCSAESAEPSRIDRLLLLVVASDVLGKDEDIGRVLIQGFLETMKTYKKLPGMIFFLNAGVKLTTVNIETVALLRDMAVAGVEIYSCGTCLKHYGLEDSLQVGYRGTTVQLIEAMTDFAKTVWVG